MFAIKVDCEIDEVEQFTQAKRDGKVTTAVKKAANMAKAEATTRARSLFDRVLPWRNGKSQPLLDKPK